MFNTPEFKVGFLVVVVSSLIGIMSIKVTEGPGVFGTSKEYWFDLDDAGGLVPNGAVKVAGIKKGIIREIELVGGQARVHLIIDKDVPMKVTGHVEIRADGILGDKHVELVTGPPGDPALAPGEKIINIAERGSLENLVGEVSKITESLGDVAENLRRATGPDGDKATTLGRIVHNLEKITDDVAHMTGRNRDKVDDIVDRVHSITEALDEFIAADDDRSLQAVWDRSVSRIDKTLANLEEITDKVNNGEGTVGRLINDEETVDELNTAIYKVNEFLGGADVMETSIDYHTESLTDLGLMKSYLNVKIQPGLDRYYEVGIVDDPRGVVRRFQTDTTVGSGPTTSTREVKTFENDIKFNILFAKNFYDFTIKGGIIESSGGVAFDYKLFRNRLKLSIEAFEFDNLHVRAFAKYNFFKGVYLIGGGDDVFSNEGLASPFIGAGIFITNDDLKVLASKVSF